VETAVEMVSSYSSFFSALVLSVCRYGYDVALARKVVHVGLTRRLMVDLYPLAVHCVKVGSRGREDIVEKV